MQATHRRGHRQNGHAIKVDQRVLTNLGYSNDTARALTARPSLRRETPEPNEPGCIFVPESIGSFVCSESVVVEA